MFRPIVVRLNVIYIAHISSFTFRNEVLVAKIVLSGHIWSHCLNSLCLSGSTSVMASTMMSAVPRLDSVVRLSTEC